MTKVERVRELSNRALQAMHDELEPDVAIMALLDAGVRLLCFSNRRLSTADACKQLARVLERIRGDEAGN